MKRITTLRTISLMVGLSIGLAGPTITQAQVGYNQPGYDPYGYPQPGSGQPAYGQPGYGQAGNSAPDFYNELAPYGQWVQTPEYGTVWIPSAEPDFQPYASNGHWVVTEYGNTWVSDYAWGWAPFHYGRWYLDSYRGWAWVPGYDWGPAWVNWRSGGGYYGWAPLGPGVNRNVNFNIPANYWVFVPQAYITSPRIYNYFVPRPRAVTLYQSTTIINNVYQVNNRSYFYGPRREEIEYITRRPVTVYRLENAGRPGRAVIRDNAIGIYRPDMNGGWREGRNRFSDDQWGYSRRTYGANSGNYGAYSRRDRNYSPNPGNPQPERPSYGWGQSPGQRPDYTQQPQTSPSPAQPNPSYPPQGQPGGWQSRRQERYEQRSQDTPQVQGGYSPEGHGRSRGPR